MAVFTLRSTATTSALRSATADVIRYYDRTGLPNFQLFVNGSERTAAGDTIPIDDVRIDESGSAQPGQLSASIESSTYSPPARGEVWLEDNVVARRAFGGYITSRRGEQLYGAVRRTNIAATGYDYLLDRIIVPSWSVPAGDDRSMLQSVIGAYGRPPLRAPDFTVAITTFAVPAQSGTNTSLRGVIEQIRDAAGTNRFYFIDADARLNYGLVAAPAPYVVSDLPTGTQVGYSALDPEFDDGSIFDFVYIVGGAPEGSGWYPSDPAGTSGLVYATGITVNESLTPADLATYGAAFLSTRNTTVVRGRLVITGYDGWNPGQTITIYNTAYIPAGATYQIRSVSHTLHTGSGLRTYAISFGELPKSLSRILASE